MKIRIYRLGGGNFLKYCMCSFLCLPHALFYLLSKNKKTIQYDVKRWIELTINEYHGTIFDLWYLLVFWKEFRNVFYLRIGVWRYLLQWYIRPLQSLFINTPSDCFGAGTFIQHGFATIIAAERIGRNCFINQQVTIGYNGSRKYGYGKPIVEDNVRISSGAKVAGKLTVGEGAVIGMNAVVVKDVPRQSVIVPSTMMIKENNREEFHPF